MHTFSDIDHALLDRRDLPCMVGIPSVHVFVWFVRVVWKCQYPVIEFLVVFFFLSVYALIVFHFVRSRSAGDLGEFGC